MLRGGQYNLGYSVRVGGQFHQGGGGGGGGGGVHYMLGYIVRGGQYILSGGHYTLGYIVRGDNIRGDNIYYDTSIGYSVVSSS